MLNETAYVKTAEEILDLKIFEQPMLLPPILQKVGVASLCGSSDVGKSYMCLNLVVAICSGEDKALGFEVRSKYKSAIVVCTEDFPEDVCVRLTALVENKTLEPGALRFIFETKDLISRLRTQLKKMPADIIIIDTFGDLFSGSINQSPEIRKFLMPYKDLAKEFRCLIVFNHHVGKGKEQNDTPSKNDVLGSQAIESACRSVLILKKQPDATRVLTVVKGNYIPEEEKNKGYVYSFDPKTGYTPTGSSMQYLKKSSEKDEEIEKHVLELYPIHKSYDRVAEELKRKGYKVDKNKVMKFWRKHNPSKKL